MTSPRPTLDVCVRVDPASARDAAVLDVETLLLAQASAAVADALAGREPSPSSRPL